MFKTNSLRQIAFFSSSILTGLIVLLLHFIYHLPNDLLKSILWITGVWLVLFASLLFILTKFVKNRISPIYRMIKTSNDGVNTSDLLLDSSDLISVAEEDVSDWMKKTQNEVETLKKLEAYRRDYVGNVSHELKTPIFNIQGFIQTLLEGGMNDDKILKNYLKRASVNVDRLNTIVQDLDTISRLEAGELTLNKTVFDIQKLIKEVFVDVKELAEKKKIALVFDNPKLEGVNVIGDRNTIHQVLTNLMVNSIKYGKEDGETRVKLFDVQDDVLIEVIDNGLGIDEKHINHLFDRFYRIDKSRSRTEGGSGLGLSIVKHIIDAHNQQINVRSTLGKGSTFAFTLLRSV